MFRKFKSALSLQLCEQFVHIYKDLCQKLHLLNVPFDVRIFVNYNRSISSFIVSY